MKNCPHCGHSLNPDQKVCPACGYELPASTPDPPCPPQIPGAKPPVVPPAANQAYSPAPMQKPEKSKKTGLIIALIAALVVIVLGGIGAAVYFVVNSTKKTVVKVEESVDSLYEADNESETRVETVKVAEETVTETYANTYPNYKFGSKWDTKKQSVASIPGARPFHAEGFIEETPVEVEGYWLPTNQLVGRYYSDLGIQLDFNGYFSEYTGDLKIKLGHDSEESKWELSPIEDGHYAGTWGKVGKPSELWIGYD